jgi:hypothetical protein
VADCCQVLQILTGKVLGEQAEEWDNLRLHFEGEGNISCQITQAEAINKILHYKQERSMKFSTFLCRMQVMFQNQA